MKRIVFNRKYFLLLAWIIICSSCKKDSANSTSRTELRTELLTSAPWKLIALTAHGDWDHDGVVNPVDKDEYAGWDACDKDNLLIFNAGGSGISDQGPDNCSGLPQTHEFSWTFYNPYTQTVEDDVIKFENFGFEALGIEELSETTLKVKNLIYYGGIEYHLYTYSH